jgi:hypothetical protein
MNIILAILFASYVIVPISIVIGWMKWWHGPRQTGIFPRSSLISFVLTSGSASLALIWITVGR